MSVKRATPKIPDHEVIRKIGSGAYGEVWLARTITGAWRAIKIVKREDFDDDRSFQREFEGIRHYEPIARNHPGLVHILHVGTGMEPTPFYYYVMELGDDIDEGASISPDKYKPRTLQTDKKISTGTPLPVDYTLEIGLQLSGALAYLHSLDLTHRDIKPANVIFVHDHPKLADVGLVAQRGQHTFVGTEGFIPHEGPGTKRADVFALGKVLYELATGKDRLDFPELPDDFPEASDYDRWRSLNQIICDCCEPDLERCRITTAVQLHNALKEVKKGRTYQSCKKGLFSSPGRTLAALSGIALAFTLMLGVLYFSFPGFQKENGRSNPPDTTVGTFVISSEPVGASIYNAAGEQIGVTPYGPETLPVGSDVYVVLKKAGYQNLTAKGVIRANRTLGLGGELVPFTPPVPEKNWTDAMGMIYAYNENNHLSNTPVTAAAVEQFFRDKKTTDRKPKTFTYTPPNQKESQQFALIKPGEAVEYAEWLSDLSRKKGLLREKEAIMPVPVKEWKDWKLPDEDRDNSLSAYLLQAGKVDYVKALISSNPEGATVTLNGIELGKTPIDWHRLSPGHYSVNFKLPGYERYETSGNVEPGKDLTLHCNLVKDGSVEFNKEWKNTLGMDFVPIDAHFSASKYLTRQADYQNYIQDQHLPPLPEPPFSQTLDDPVVMVTRKEAEAFAQWLTEKERRAGLIEITDSYRLPTDKEWTRLAGGGPEEGKTPYERHKASVSPEMSEDDSDLFPWGNTWPPPAGAGNFADESAAGIKHNDIIRYYNDKYVYTSPVGKFHPNRLGLFDITGNVWEWVEDEYGGGTGFVFKDWEVSRGGGWDTDKSQQLLTRYRMYRSPGKPHADTGFRLVLVRNPIERKPIPTEGDSTITLSDPEDELPSSLTDPE